MPASLGPTTIGLRANTAQFNRNIRAARTQLRAFGRQARSLQRTFTGLGAALVGALGVSSFVRTIADFEKSIAGVAAVTRATAQEMEVLTDTARSLGATTEFSATQAADALRFLGQAGFSAADAVAASASVLDLATAGTLDLAEAADIASNVMSGFGIAATESARATDVLAAIASRANTDVRQIGEAMAYVAPVARAMGVSLETSAAALGVLGDAGIQASSAGTALRASLAALVNPSTAAANAIERMGLSLAEVDPSSENFVDVIARLSDAGLTAADALTIFGNRAAPAILALTSQVPRLRELEEAMHAAGGEAARMAQIMRDNLGGDLDTLASSIQELVLALGDSGLTEALRATVQALTTAFRFLAEQSERIVAYLGAGLVLVLGKVVISFKALAVAVIASGRALLFLRGALIRLGLTAFVVALGEIAYQFDQFATSVGGFGEAFRLLSAVASEAFDRIVLEFRGTRVALLSLANGVGFAFNRLAFGIVTVFDSTWEQVVAVASGGTAAVNNLFTQIADFAVFAFRQPLRAIRRLFDGIINTIRERINVLIRAVNSVSEFAGLGQTFDEIPLSITISPDSEAGATEAGETVGEAFSRGYRESIERLRGERDPVIEYLNELGDNLIDQSQNYKQLADRLFTLARAPFQSIEELRAAIREMGTDTIKVSEEVNASATQISNDFEVAKQSAESLSSGIEDLATVSEELTTAQKFGADAAQSFTGSLRSVILGAKSGSDAVKGFIVSLADLVLQYTVLIPLAQQLSGAFSGAFGGVFGGAFASGGFGRGLSLVGEQGPELVDLGSGSRVYSNDQLNAALAGGGASSVTNNINIRSTDGPGVQAALFRAIPAIVDASTNKIMQDANRPGPMRQTLRGY